ncbi:MAG: O-antigen ligase family protein, partial [Patescibacteria group bacterium]
AFAVSMSLYLLGLVYLKTKKLKYQISNIKYLSRYSLFFILILTIGTPYTPSFTQILNSKYRTNSLISSTQSPISDLGGTDSGEIRKIVWRGSIDIWKRYPIFGSGVETFAYSYYLDRPVEHNLVSEWDFLYNKAHNEFLNFLATTGVVGLLSYLLIILGFLVSSIQYLISKKNRQSSYLILGFISGYIALAISNFFGFSTVAVSLLFFLYPAFFIVLTKKELPASKLANSPDIKQIIFIVITLLTTSYLLMSVFTKWLADYQFAKAKNYISEGYLSEGIELLNTAITLSPNEAVFYNQLSVASGKMAINLAQNSEPQEKLVSQFTEQALLASNITLSLNPVHNNFYKTRSRLFITLSQLNPEFLLEAKSIVKQAILLAPTDAELYYYLSNIELALGETDRGINSLEKSIELKANYGSARLALAEQYELLEKFEKAKEQYQYILEKINPEDRVIREKLEQLEK